MFSQLLLLFVCIRICHICAGFPGSQKKALDFLELHVQAVMRGTVWMLESELGSSRREAGALNFGAISSAPTVQYAPSSQEKSLLPVQRSQFD